VTQGSLQGPDREAGSHPRVERGEGKPRGEILDRSERHRPRSSRKGRGRHGPSRLKREPQIVFFRAAAGYDPAKALVACVGKSG
jgi:hypothetical protein